MSTQIEQKRSKIHLKKFLADYKAGVGDREIMQRYGLSARSLVHLIKALLEKGVLVPEDLVRRKQMMEQQELVKESEFLKSLFICPNCGHPHPQQFDVCPACGVNPADFGPAPPDEGGAEVTTTGGYFYLDDVTSTAVEEPASQDSTVPIDAPAAEPEPAADANAQPKADETTRREDKPQKPPATLPESPAPRDSSEDEPKAKTSPFKSVRALISKMKKK